MESRTNGIEKMATLSEVIHPAEQGYIENLKFVSTGLATDKEEKYYSPSDVRITDFFRFDGESDPQHNAILYLIEASDRKKGILVDAQSTSSDANVSDFIRE